MKRLVLFLGCLCLPLFAQDGGVTFQEQAARLQNIQAFLVDFRPHGAPVLPKRANLAFMASFNVQPSVDSRVGNKDEPVDPPSVVPQLRGRYAHRSGLMVGGAFAPGIEFEDYKAEYVSVEAGYQFSLAGWQGRVRASYSDGDIDGPITELEAEDAFTFENKGVDFSLGRQWRAFHLYGFVGYTDVETSLDIEEDDAFLENEEDTYYGGFGVSYIRKRLTFNFEQNFTDDYLANITLTASYRFGK